MADVLTAAQRAAVQNPGGPILVAAAAGSGKTKVIVERLMNQILRSDRECSINDFLIITFTKKAAAELRARIARELAARLAEDPENRHLQKQQSRVYLTQISTVHAFCSEMIREFSYELDVPADFRMLEQTEAELLQIQILEDLLEERYEDIASDAALRQLVDGLGAGRDDRRILSLILGVYTTTQLYPDPDAWLSKCEASLDTSKLDGAEQTLWGRYILDHLRGCAKDQADALDQISAELGMNETLAKYCPVFAANADGLRALARCERWDEALAAFPAAADFGRLPPIKSCDDPALQSRAKAIREQAKTRIRKWGEELRGPSAEMLSDLAESAVTLNALFQLTREFSRRFAAEKHRIHALDFSDLEHYALKLLLEPDGVTPTQAARRIGDRFREIMVDEYQDTNQVQDAIFRALSTEGKNRFMVGDVKQSIYRFRLADPAVFLKKYEAYPNAASADPAGRQRILLSHNFRSGEAVLEAVNAVFGLCMSPQLGGLEYGPSEALRPGRPMPPLPQTQVELHCLSTAQEAEDAETPEKNRAEASFAARRIRALLEDGTLVRDGELTRPVEPRDIVILLRSPKNVAETYLDALHRLGIPASSDTGEDLLNASEIQALLCLLRVLDNAHQDIPLTGALLSPILGIPAAVLAHTRIRSDSDLWDALADSASAEPALSEALATIERLRLLSRDLPLPTLLEKLQQAVDLEAVYGAMEDGDARIRRLRSFFELASAFSEGGQKSLHQFLHYVDSLQERGGIPTTQPGGNAVSVMSVHKSKGLEFPVVLLCGLSRRFNLDDLKEPVLFHSELGAGCSVFDSATRIRYHSIARAAIARQTRLDNLSEELRILYVAMTRARDMLIMSCCGENLRGRLQDLAIQLTPETAKQLAADATCPGDWVLMTALLRTEAGAIHAAAGKPETCSVSEHPWRICWEALSPEASTPKEEAHSLRLPGAVSPDAVRESLAFRYPHTAAQTIPSKLTATQLKGRALDREADDGAPRQENVQLRRPYLMQAEKALTPAQKGTAVHQAMQYLDFSSVDSAEAIQAQLRRMVEEDFLTAAQAEAVDPEKLLRVFRGPLGDMIRGADRVLREFKFSVLSPAQTWYPDCEGEKILLQGVTDCCLFSDGGITVVDFKTDRIRPGAETEAGEKYRPQLEAYAAALSRIFQLPVRKKILYFFASDTMTEL